MSFFVYHDSHSLDYRQPFGAVTCGQMIRIRLDLSSEIPIESLHLRLWERDRERLVPMCPKSGEFSEQRVVFEVEYEAPNTPGLVWYYFRLQVGGQTYYYGNNVDKLGGEGHLGNEEPPSYQVTVHSPSEVPAWYKRGIMYQIFVDRFYHAHEDGFVLYPRKNALLHADWYDTPFYIKDERGRVTHWDFFGGNLLGVIEKLPYLHELGISIIYFNPIFDAPSNHKYDTADYHKIDPMFGDEELFEHLIKEARQYGIAIVLDGVFSHTGSDSVYFNRYNTYPSVGAYQSAESSYYQWYQFKPNSQEYQSWWGVDALPEVNELNPAYQEFLFGAGDGVIQKWMKKGIAGWRLDVADELPDEFIRKLRQTIKTINPEAVLIGEVWEDASNKGSYGKLREYFWGYELDATMNYPFRDSFLSFMLSKTTSNLVYQQVMSLYENYPRENFYGAMNLIGSHDRERILTLLGEAPDEKALIENEKQSYRLSPEARELAVQRLKLVSLIQMTFPGVPCVYYGDEVGLEGYSDPYNRATYPWNREDQEILLWYKTMIRLRLEYEVLQSGDFQSFYSEPDIYGFKRSDGDEEITVLINRHASQAKEITLPSTLHTNLIKGALVLDLLSGQIITGQTAQTLILGPLSAQALYCKQSLPPFPRQNLGRSCGVLMHVSSLPSDFGSGDMGIEAYRFVDFLVESGQSLWQVLPLNPVGLGDSPYQSDSAFAGNPRLISLEGLMREGLLEADFAEELQLAELSAEMFKDVSLRKAFKGFKAQLQEQGQLPDQAQDSDRTGPEFRFLARQNYLRFQQDHREWLDDYALYRALKSHFGDIAWYDWEPELAWRNTERVAEYVRLLEEEVEFNRFVQYAFYYQWQGLRHYAKAKGIKLIGDIPIFVAADSCDVWVNHRFFKLDEGGRPAKVAGVPPDYFCKTGQLWGNPVYDWDVLGLENYTWWKQRIKLVLGLFDFIRLDHFRGFEAYWEIEAREETAMNGRWLKGPGKRFFESLAEEFGELPFIAEDLGTITPEVNVLKRIFSFPGMKVLQFTALEEMIFEEDSNLIYYSGTHDNDTLVGWYKSTWTDEERADYAGEDQKDDPKEACRKLIEDLYKSPASWVITPMQDILGLDTDARLNVPGTIEGNWQWKLKQDLLTTEVKEWLRSVARETKRLP
ncbi:bifunctional glycogen debranching protein GlgX/4-alpha-glucanotransferase [Desulfosporosinus sp. BICA1-9]|uniref:bifunctional glycogen debranching protein GlgX/4-alpha-glucanotransferase n=1 Tax=Desulfosporosinus sp. BICA1-9 TaxID=1531958 RepID=UPI00054B802C|nr:bifunctional glycogen debranching protein GlgX/4-alpha-glucanotransferase [Desulfosporosinus sp. BICA1-9]KJS48938.1 MAG: 4-alpha-glucanotransferase [Peptococcaceae bacterium BRH_c23]KJS90561.1 MAG: 4-alpha-glucanotransferase [Desulfosporosinus sp. BICA1-9]HBW33868.1 4-alpha-glucanotransferase [Desulfosporosinus sp.]